MESAIPDKLLAKSEDLINRVETAYLRSLHAKVHWNDRLIGLKGARGTGKTTLLLQHLRQSGIPAAKRLYLSLDDLYFATHPLTDTAEEFRRSGGELLVLDEVHRYPDWAREVKNLYDSYPDLKIVFTGSSILDLSKSGSDLGRRAMMYELPGLSFREFLGLFHGLHIGALELEELLVSGDLRGHFTPDFRPLPLFREYLRMGYYPFVKESPETYHYRLEQLVNLVVEYDLAGLPGFDIRNARKLLQLIGVISREVPFTPNMSKLAERTGIHRNTLANYLHHLADARLVHLLYPEGTGVALLQKPEKIYLHNTNLVYAIGLEKAEMGNLRETFFISQVSPGHRVNTARKGDFMVDDRYTFEVGGKGKGQKQIAGVPDAYVVVDDLDFPPKGKLPLWAFGFLY